MSVVSLISNGLKAVAAFFGWREQRDAALNSPAMKANAAAKTDAKIDADIARANADADKGDLERARKLAAE